MILASSGIVASQIASFDADASAFFARVTAAGGSLTLSEKTATNQLVLDLKANSLWTPMKAIYPMVGSSAAACAQNLKSSSFTGTFTSGWTFASTGATPNGTNAYMDTNLTPNGNLSQNDAHVSFYSRTNITTGDKVDMGCNSSDFYLSAWYGSQKAISNINGSGFGGGASNTTSLGLFLSQRTTSTNTNIYQNNTLIKTHSQVSTTPVSSPIYLGRNLAIEYSAREFAFVSVGDSFNATQRTNFYTNVQTFQTTLSRNV